MRFGYPATNEHILRYVTGLNFERDAAFGIYNRKLELVAMAHLALSLDCTREAEFGVSVLKKATGRGYGSHLFRRAIIHGRNRNVESLVIHASSENAAMLKILRKAGATLEQRAIETDAHLLLECSTLDSRVREPIEEQFARVNFQLKVWARNFSNVCQRSRNIGLAK